MVSLAGDNGWRVEIAWHCPRQGDIESKGDSSDGDINHYVQSRKEQDRTGQDRTGQDKA